MKITKAILTGGGRATRLRPITTTINKHLIPLANQPMIFHAIQKAVEAGIKEIFINTNPEETELQKAVGDGSRWGIKIKFFVQEGGPKGIAHVVNCAKKFIGNDPFMFYLSDNIILGSLAPTFKKFDEENLDCLLAFSKVPDPERFGVPVFDRAGKLVDVLEKPANPPNNFAVTGIYLFGPKIYFKAFKHMRPSARGEYEIPDIFSYFLKHGLKVGWEEITGWWKDTGKPEDLISASRLLLDELPDNEFKIKGSVGSGVKIDGKVKVSGESLINGASTIIGPVIIGQNCVIEDCLIGPNVTVGDGSRLKNVTISDSIVFGGANLDAKIKIANSIIGERAAVKQNGVGGYHRLIIGDHTLIEV